MLRLRKTILLVSLPVTAWLMAGLPAQASHWRVRPRTVVGFSVGIGAPVVVASPVVVAAPPVVFDPLAPVIVQPAPAIVQPTPIIVPDPWSAPPVYYRSATGIYIGPGFGFYYQRWR